MTWDYLNNVITGNDTWIYCHDPAFKQLMSKWIPWSSSALKPQATKLKCVVITFFDQEGLIYAYAVPDGQTVNANWYIKVLKRLIMVHIMCKRSHYRNGQCKLQHDNVCLHIAQCVWDFLASHDVEISLTLPTVWTLRPMIFSCFVQARDLKGRHFDSPEAAETAFKYLAGNRFQYVIDKWQRCGAKCVAHDGEYLEGAVVNTE